MAALDFASKGTPSLVYSSSIISSFLNHIKILDDLKKTSNTGASIAGNAVVTLTLDDGTKLNDREVLDYLARLATEAPGSPALSTVQEWMTRCEAFSAPEFRQIQTPLEGLDAHLSLRSHIVGYQINYADLLLWATLSSNHVALSWVRRSKNNVSRWYDYIETSNPWAKEALGEVHTASTKEKAAAKAAAAAAGASYDIDLPQVSGPITTRFPPEPSGYLHIGHAKAALLNEYFARLREGGCLICRFDDTNPSNENSEFQDSILEDLKRLEILPDKFTFSSNYFQATYDLAIQLIKDGKGLC